MSSKSFHVISYRLTSFVHAVVLITIDNFPAIIVTQTEHQWDYIQVVSFFLNKRLRIELLKLLYI
jgi:hypothetical protein